MPPLRGSLDISQTSGAAQLALAGHTKRALPRSSDSARLNLRLFVKYRGGAQGKEIQRRFCVGTAHAFCLSVGGRFAPTYGFGFAFDFGFSIFPPLFRHRVAEAGQGILTNMFEHVDAQRIVRVYEEA